MRLFTTVAAMRCYLNIHRSKTPQVAIGFVPTMGSLHPGHLSLIERARVENTVVVVSIFVNPLQFGPQEDLKQYPRPLEQDLSLCEQAEVDVVFTPSAEEILGLDHQHQTTVVPPSNLISVLCGPNRPGHFPGVTTIVAKFLNIIEPHRVYLGRKDAQQLAIIRRMVTDLHWPIEIVACPIIREVSGLAYSSRNQYLTPQEKQQATVLYRALGKGKQVFLSGNSDAEAILAAVHAELATTTEIKLEYLQLVDPDTMAPLTFVREVGLLAIAARVNTTRLIDNVILRNRKPILAIDGPAGAGKSTVTRQVAQQLNLLFLDTGAMYRAVTWLVLEMGIDISDQPAVAELVHQCQIELKPREDQLEIYINSRNVTAEIRSQQVTANVSAIAAQPAVRESLVEQQKAYGRTGGVVAEGRDIGTYVFPDAELKIFLTASVKERSQRRQLELQQQGQGEISLEQIEQDIAQRDYKDSTRSIAPLRKAADAIEIQTDGLTIEQVTERIIRLYYEKTTHLT
ncbi:bifunctional pantoate--beta-alanine ligase/(d)CMP kinase [Limnoraphis robusta]|uniref:Bifunctional pantoate ligase/cytidylate kinase n=1 Tax=Limnoraphis robusta CCNP1315 TaxID=3110306 RepID=A0ABU5TT78_9CYAN|nr:bifunctional pantoate--beta-alanine ligase/(d)CMP kinase [Limnoraphis robusta]MEA5518107.1 bifunctional pantoate--beta-alanine ligase/(d)CMP kinase [Limnoraphis robusta CCNP1315]MEA5543449.1 bifunctional pantoate--beta-alanine ligase/(d)CMP kinase [Limnoraphis robusta CCNP1324]